MKHPTKAKKPQKGVAGKHTGGSTRRAISAAKARGVTTKQIARAGMRTTSTINSIVSGKIKNPPKNLAGKIRKAKPTKKR